MNRLFLNHDVELMYAGPDPILGPLPAIFYFALSAQESLSQDPYNQPVRFLSSFPVRIFSLDLPFHGKGLSPLTALTGWAEEIAKGHNLIHHFCDKVASAVEKLIEKELVLPDRMGVMGLSRGAFIAAHVAAALPSFRSILGFAPLTKLTFAQEFKEGQQNALADALNLSHLTDKLATHHLRFYIGNHDTRVGTANCFHFIEALTKAAFQKKIQTSPIELIIGPSIGRHGHGTSKEVFENGALWMAQELGLS